MSMRLWEKFVNIGLQGKLRLGRNATIVVENTDGSESTVNLLELAALDGIAAADLAKIDGITNGTAAAGKAVVLTTDKVIDIINFAAIGASDASLGVNGLAAAQGGAIVVTGGTSSTAGNAGGAVSLVGGTPGATGVGGAVAIAGAAGGATSGKGGAATVAGGAGTAGNGDGGSAILTGGAKHGSGLDGAVINRGTFQLRKQPAPQTATDTATLTVAQMLGGLLVATPTAAAAYTMPTGTALKAALPTDLAADDSFDVIISNLGGTGDDITLTASTDITIVGDPVVGPIADVATEQSSVGRFRLRFTTGVTFVAYRIG
jgi:hypothetical protein